MRSETRLINTGSVEQLVSGGQTGADIAALRAAARLGLGTGGFAAAGFMTEAGPDPALATTYGLVEVGGLPCSLAQSYVLRSMANVDAADATIAISLGPSVGTDKTIGYACTRKWQAPRARGAADTAEPKTAHRPCLVVHTLDPARHPAVVCAARAFLQKHRPRVVNVCGHRAWPAVPDFERVVENLLVNVFENEK